MRPIPTSRRQSAFFLLASDHAVASTNEQAALNRYRWNDSEPAALTWTPDAAVVELRALDDWEFDEAEAAAEVRARRTPQGEALYDGARTAALAASRAEQTAAKLEGRRPRPDVFARAWSRFVTELSAEDHGYFVAYQRWRGHRAREICRRTIKSIILDVESQQTIRAWVRGELARAAVEGVDHTLATDLPDSAWADGYPVAKVGQLMSRWLRAARDLHAVKHSPALAAAERQRIAALQAIRARLLGEERIPTVEEIEAEANAAAAASLVDLDQIDAPVLRALAVQRRINLRLEDVDGALTTVDPDTLDADRIRAILRAELPKADLYPEMTAAVLAVKDAAAAVVWHGAESAGPIWDEIADHAERFSKLGKGGSSSSTPPG